jgi:hypothetical protein
VKDESNFWQYVKKNTPTIKWTRIENACAFGTPDLLGYNTNNTFFTVELKVVKSGNKIRLSPNQISFHIRHPVNTFILVKDVKKKRLCLYLGEQVNELVACGLRATPITQNIEDCLSYLEKLS